MCPVLIQLYHHNIIQLFLYVLLQARFIWYIRMEAVLGNVDAQIRGIVDLIYCYRDGPAAHEDLPSSASQSYYLDILAKGVDVLASALPFRFSGFHFCYDDPRLQPLAGILQMVIGKETRSRCRTHYGRSSSPLFSAQRSAATPVRLMLGF